MSSRLDVSKTHSGLWFMEGVHREHARLCGGVMAIGGSNELTLGTLVGRPVMNELSRLLHDPYAGDVHSSGLRLVMNSEFIIQGS
eukprot:1835138-Amphidinium_carterae.1